jgi:hypothetical protein
MGGSLSSCLVFHFFCFCSACADVSTAGIFWVWRRAFQIGVYVPWPQIGRLHYEEIEIKNKLYLVRLANALHSLLDTIAKDSGETAAG